MFPNTLWADDTKKTRGSRRGGSFVKDSLAREKAIEVIKKDGEAVEAIKKDPALNERQKTAAVEERNKNIERTMEDTPAPLVYDAGATVAFTQGDNNTGFKRSNKAIEMGEDEGDPEPWSAALATRAGAYAKIGDNPRAAADAKRALELDPTNKRAHGIYKLTEGRPIVANMPQAGKLAAQQVADSPENALPGSPESQAVAGSGSEGSMNTASKDAEGIVGANQIRSRDLAESAMKLLNLDPRAALASAKKAAAIDPANAKAHLGAALAALRLSEHAAAKDSAGRAIGAAESQGKNGPAAGGGAWLAQAYKARAMAEEGLGELPRAQADYRRAYELDPAADAGELKRLMAGPNAPAADVQEASRDSLLRSAAVQAALLAAGGMLIAAGMARRRRQTVLPSAAEESTTTPRRG